MALLNTADAASTRLEQPEPDSYLESALMEWRDAGGPVENVVEAMDLRYGEKVQTS